MTMMNCPRCDFTQPEDQYCAKCGVDMENYSKHIPIYQRLLNSSQLHLIIILSIILGTLFYLVISQKELIQQEVGRIFPGLPLLSSESLDPEAGNNSLPGALPEEDSSSKAETLEGVRPNGSSQEFIEPSKKTGQENVKLSPPAVEVRYLEISKDNIQALAASGEVLQDLENWRVIYLPSSPSVKSLIKSSRPQPGSVKRALPLRGELEVLSGDYDPDPTKSFLNFSMIWRLPDQVEWSLISQFRSNDDGRQMTMKEHQGRMTWNPMGALIIIFDPIQRISVGPNVDLSKSPLRILQSSDFQNGLSDLVIWVEISNPPPQY